MSDNRIIQFEYRSKDGVLEPKNCIINLFTELINIKGEHAETVFDPVRKGPKKMVGLYIEYKGKVYGSITTTLVQLLAEISACGCHEDDEFRLFDIEFDFEFE